MRGKYINDFLAIVHFPVMKVVAYKQCPRGLPWNFAYLTLQGPLMVAQKNDDDIYNKLFVIFLMGIVHVDKNQDHLSFSITIFTIKDFISHTL